MIPGYEVVDLSLPLAENLPCSWPGNIPFQHKLFNWFTDLGPPTPHSSRGPFHTRWLMMAEHTGTHVDAPSHWVPPPESGLPHSGPAGSISTDDVPLEQLMGPAVVIDASKDRPSEPGKSPRIEVDELIAFEKTNGPIKPGEIVLVRTDWDAHYVAGDAGRRYIVDCVSGRRAAWPALTAEAVRHLVGRGVRCLGIDTPSAGAVEDGHPAHIAGLSHGLVYLEGLARLSMLPARGATFLFLPVHVRGGSGAPGRAIALIRTG